MKLAKIIQGYRRGLFLMDNGAGLKWYGSPQRTMMPLDQRFRFPRSLRRVLNQQRFSTAINQDFAGVVAGCADRSESWISAELKQIYIELQQAGWAYSFEAWQGDQLAGGILGIAIGGAFIGESMFYNIPDASKVALVCLVEHLRTRGYLLFDVQLMNPHLARFGAYSISNANFKKQFTSAIGQVRTFL
jgi:leucyl/phenylalanyl-tRNA--protein transferase